MGCESSQPTAPEFREGEEDRPTVLLQDSEGRSCLPVWAAPHPSSMRVGMTPSGEEAVCLFQSGDYIRVQSKDLDGWVFRKDAVFLKDSSGSDDEEAAESMVDESPEPLDDGAAALERVLDLSRCKHVLLRQAQGRPSVLVRAWQREDAVLVGEIPSGQQALCLGECGDFVQVHWKGLEGWVMQDDASALGAATAAPGPGTGTPVHSVVSRPSAPSLAPQAVLLPTQPSEKVLPLPMEVEQLFARLSTLPPQAEVPAPRQSSRFQHVLV